MEHLLFFFYRTKEFLNFFSKNTVYLHLFRIKLYYFYKSVEDSEFVSKQTRTESYQDGLLESFNKCIYK
jgi:hypothetical protein